MDESITACDINQVKSADVIVVLKRLLLPGNTSQPPSVGGDVVRSEARRWALALALQKARWWPRLHVSQGFTCEHAESPAIPSAQLPARNSGPAYSPPDVGSEPACLTAFLWGQSDTRRRGAISLTAFESLVTFEICRVLGALTEVRERPDVRRRTGSSFLLYFWGTCLRSEMCNLQWAWSA